jgi:DNA-binding LacI/PurR family transcriptional regulator
MASPARRVRRISIRDVARAAGVSTTTVSHAINGKGRVDAETRARVIAIAEELGYRANPTAVNLLRRRTGVLALTLSAPEGLTVGLMELDFFVRFVNGATAAALDRGYALILAPPGSGSSFDAVDVDGGIVIDPLADDPLLEVLERRGIPAVTSGRDPGRPETEGAWVDNDLAASTHELLDHMVDAGARSIGMVAAPAIYSYGVDYRRGYEEWCAAGGAQPLIAEAAHGLTETAGYEAASRLLSGPERPDAIFAALDRYALGTLLAASAHGLLVPDDLLVGAGTDSELIRAASPPITGLDLHPERNGRRAVEMLITRIEDPSLPERPVRLPADLAPRASTRA